MPLHISLFYRYAQKNKSFLRSRPSRTYHVRPCATVVGRKPVDRADSNFFGKNFFCGRPVGHPLWVFFFFLVGQSATQVLGKSFLSRLGQAQNFDGFRFLFPGHSAGRFFSRFSLILGRPVGHPHFGKIFLINYHCAGPYQRVVRPYEDLLNQWLIRSAPFAVFPINKVH